VYKLLKELEGVPENQRSARFICVMVFMEHADDPFPVIAQGVWEGRILNHPSVIMVLAMIRYFGCRNTIVRR